MYSNAPYWFVGLLVLLVLGFWPSYFSSAAPEATFEQHFHSVTMIGWILMLIVQPWLIRTRRRQAHRMIGRFSFLWAPLVVFSAFYVVLDHLVKIEPPYPSLHLSFFWLGFASALYYSLLFSLAIINRKDMQLHARYMLATSLGFITPGLGRILSRLGEQTGLEFLNFQIGLWAPAIIGGVMIARDARTPGGVRPPWVVATVGWLIIVAGFHILPSFDWFQGFADIYGSLSRD